MNSAVKKLKEFELDGPSRLKVVETKPVVPKKVQIRADRIKVSSIQNIDFKLSVGVGKTAKEFKNFKVIDISASGIGVEAKSGVLLPVDAQNTFEASVRIGDSKKDFQVAVKLATKDGKHFGFKFVNPSSVFVISLDKHFETEVIASRMKKVKESEVFSQDGCTGVLYTGTDNCYLYYNFNSENQLTCAKLSVYGNVFYWARGSRSQFYQNRGQDLFYFEAPAGSFTTEKTPPVTLQKTFHQFLSNVKGLNPAHELELIRLIVG